MDASGYRRMIERYIDDAIVRRIAEEYARGRILLFGTTNIDATRPVFWNLGAIAASGHPDAKRLIHDVIKASSAIPAVFPPVLIPVEAGDERYDEMHVDGGATQQVTLFSPELRTTEIDRALGATVDRTAWVVMNRKLQTPYEPVLPRVTRIAGRSTTGLIIGSGSGDI